MALNKSEIETIIKKGSGGFLSKPSFWLLALAILAAAAAWYWYAGVNAASGETYVTEAAKRSDIVVTVTATGTVEPTNLVEVSSELSGTVQAVMADDNDEVGRNQVLARLDTGKLEASVEHSRATLAARLARQKEAEVTLDELKTAYERAEKLEQRGVVSATGLLTARATYERAKASLNSAVADVRVAQADLTTNETNLEKACICSPIDGIVLSRNVEVGQIVASSLQAPVLFIIAEDLRKMELLIDIDEADIGKVTVGNRASFYVEAYQGLTFPAVIAELRYMPETVEGVVTYKAVLSIDNEELLLRPGMTATAEIVVAEVSDALVVPNAALRLVPPAEEETEEEGGTGLLGMLFRDAPRRVAPTKNVAGPGGRRTIWILRDEKALGIEVLPGETDGSVTEILEGDLAQGDAVITDMTAGQ
ncbi:MAG: efflux RND transporter periplasmic adaptor subunit [Fimbriimonadaceae bacterium]|nr:efflux RND transporter periplasmic adaptor subunit [Alphaproteobacteria bacterium]